MPAFLKSFFKSRRPGPPRENVAAQAEQPAAKPLDAPEPAPPSGPDQAEHIAIKGKTAQERRQAAEQIDDEATLQRIAKAAKGHDKGVYQIARGKLQNLRQVAAEAAARRAEVEKLIAQTEAHAITESTKLYQARFESLLAAWNALGENAAAAESERFQAARAQCQLRCNELAARAEAEARVESRRRERSATLEILQQTLEQLRSAPADQIPNLSALDAMQKTQETRWLEATRETPVDKQEQKQYEQLMHALRHYLNAVRAFETHQETLHQALQNKSAGQPALSAAVEAIQWPAGYSQPVLLSDAVKATRKQAPAQQPAAEPEAPDTGKLSGSLDRLEQVVEQKELKLSRKLLREAQHAADRLPEKARRHFQGRLSLLARQVQDLQDWQGFATRPKQEALCERMEHLRDQHMEPELKAAKIHELQQAWRELGGSSDQALWQRFKAAADEAFLPCQTYFAARNELKAANLHRREQLCDELAQFVTQVDWSACDWRGIEKIHRKAREEWREAKPVDFRHNRGVQKRFDELLKQIDSHLDAERDRNEAAKAAIVARAQALVEAENLGEATAQAKSLQKEWEAIGITRQSQDRAQWKAFRAACDALFARRDSRRAEQESQAGEQRAAAEAILDELQGQLEVGSPVPDLDQNLRQFRQLHLPAAHREALNRRFQAIEKQASTLRHSAARQDQRADWLARLQQPAAAGGGTSATPRELCIRAEILAGLDSPPEDREQRMALQVERLSAGLGQGQSFADAWAEMEHVVSLWQASGGADADPGLQARLAEAIESLGKH